MAGIGNATGHGILVREGDALERLAKVSKVAFDKTGTLTYGVPVVTDVKSFLKISKVISLLWWNAAENLWDCLTTCLKMVCREAE